jgi:sec-independent protein translocase protein TatB
MFDIGFLELLIVAIISLLVLGPERLPVAARAAGRWLGKARRIVRQFSQEVDRQIEIEELRQQLKEQGESLDIEEDANKIHQTVSQALNETASEDQSSAIAQASTARAFDSQLNKEPSTNQRTAARDKPDDLAS